MARRSRESARSYPFAAALPIGPRGTPKLPTTRRAERPRCLLRREDVVGNPGVVLHVPEGEARPGARRNVLHGDLHRCGVGLHRLDAIEGPNFHQAVRTVEVLGPTRQVAALVDAADDA